MSGEVRRGCGRAENRPRLKLKKKLPGDDR